MEISNKSNLYFGCLKIKNPEANILKKEGAYAQRRFEVAKEQFKNFHWHLNAEEEHYSLTSPTTAKTYMGPYSIKRHYKKPSAKSGDYKLVITMNEKGTQKYTIPYEDASQMQQAYKAIKKNKGIDKMLKILEVLERGFNFTKLKNKIKKIES